MVRFSPRGIPSGNQALRLNLIDGIGHESQKAEIQTVNQQTIMRKASKQIEWPRSSQGSRLKSRSGREFTAYRLFRRQAKVSVKINYWYFYESLRRSIHCQIVIATIERSSRTSARALSWSRHYVQPTAHGRHRTTQSSCAVKRLRCPAGNDDSRAAGEAAEAHPPSELVRTAPRGAVGRYHVALTRNRRAGVGFGPSHQESDNWTPGNELTVIRH
jgi:hypothetical protein